MTNDDDEEDPTPARDAAGRHAAERDAASSVGKVETTLPRAMSTGQGEDLYRLLVASVRDYAIFALDTTGVILSWNQGAERIKGYRPDEIIGRHFSTFYPPEDLAWSKPAWELEEASRDGRFEDEGWRLRKDGSRFWANVIITALRDEHGELVGFAKVTRDLTERRNAELALRVSEERFRLLVGSVRDYGIFMLDPTGHIASWNEGAQRIKGYLTEEILGRHFSTFYPPEDNAWGKPAWELEVATREGRFEDEGWRLRKDGMRFWANVVITALRDDHGDMVGFAKVTRDLTDRRRAEERALEDARRVAEAEGANRAKSEFLAAMSHELRTPLNAIGGYVELMLMGIGGDASGQHQDYLQRIRSSQKHLLNIITDLLNYSRIEAGRLTYDLVDVPAQTLIDDVMPLVLPQATTKSIRLRVPDCPDGLVAHADAVKAQQVLLNLLSNAVKFTPPDGEITIECAAVGDRVVVSVGDTGPGIPDDKHRAIFEPFVQLGRSIAAAHEGTGLGLAISRDLARAMGGDVQVESIVGKGSTFRMVLPRATVSP